jgi:hypothetical protein
MRFSALIIFTLLLLIPAKADVLDAALNDATAMFEAAYPRLAEAEFGVDTLNYRNALARGAMTSSHWGEPIVLEIRRSQGGDNCARFAAFVTLPPSNGTVPLTVCPQFFNGGTGSLRALTILHEMVHVVAGPNECRAMAFAAKIEHLATGTWTPVDRYWRENGCGGSEFALP